MTDSKVHISDYTSLIRLNDALDYCGDSLLKLLQEVDAYLQTMLQVFENQWNYFKQQLEQAEQKLREAEQNLANCESSQEWDEEDQCYRPSCSAERSSVESAKNRYYDCKEKYDKACSIVSDCKHEIDEYKFAGGFFRPAGGEKTLEYMAKEHTDEAMRKMDEILNIVVKEYLGRSLAETNPNESLPSEKAQNFKDASEKVKDKQKAEASSNKIADANVAMVCSGCKRPIPICICANIREKIR